MAMNRTGTVVPVISILGKDLDAGATFNADVKKATGMHRAGELMKYDPTTKELEKSADGTGVAGVLSDDIDATSATDQQVGLIYQRGVFRRQAIESANNYAITPGGAIDKALAALGIHFELEYEGYEGVSPVPAGVEPFSSTGPSA